MKALKMWIARYFQVITETKAQEWHLSFYGNVYGDEINLLNCRSIWKDKKGRQYRVAENIPANYIIKQNKEL